MINKEHKPTNYIPKESRKKILLITDDIRSHSGVGNIAREIILNTGHYYNWAQIAGALNHPDKGKIIDLSDPVNKNLNIEDSSVILHPVDGYGEPGLLRALIKRENPDALLLITDPRYFEWVFNIENEIRSKIPIIYLNIWDDFPLPYFNKPFYESCDLLLGISKQTKYINDKVLGDDIGNTIIKYLPHGLNENEIYPIENDKEFDKYKNELLNNENPEFVLFFNSRNNKRKQIPDTILAYRLFLDSLNYEDAKKCKLIMHTEAKSEYGTDLDEVCKVFLDDKYPNSYLIHDIICSRKEINYLYNIADVCILLSSNEGWGLSLTESLLSGTPFIANVTGGMQDQMRFEDKDGNWFTPNDKVPSNNTKTYNKCGSWAFPVFPSNISLQGSLKTPYIYDDRCDFREVANVIKRVWMLDRNNLKERGRKGREWATGDEAGFTSKHQAERFIENTDLLLKNWKPINKPEIINLTKSKTNFIENPIY